MQFPTCLDGPEVVLYGPLIQQGGKPRPQPRFAPLVHGGRRFGPAAPQLARRHGLVLRAIQLFVMNKNSIHTNHLSYNNSTINKYPFLASYLHTLML